jgi:hypothetical protein
MGKSYFRLSRRWTWVIGIIVGVILVIVALSYLVQSEYLRRYAERQMNRRLKGYTVQIGRAYFHPIGFSLDLDDLVLRQDANPEPPVAKVKRLHSSIHWRELLRTHVVGDLRIQSPKLYINVKNLRTEEKSKVSLKEKGWQDAIYAVYPLKMNVFRISDGEITYVDNGPYKPLHASDVYLHA